MMDDLHTLTREVLEALGAPFPDDEIDFLPRGNWEGKARALAYIDARTVMRRLDAVVGPAHWSFDFDPLSADGKMVRGKLTVLGVTKCDAGEGASEDEVLKSAVSDALKRCAVHFGIGRYLYYLPSVWAPYDQRKRQFSETPRIQPAAVEKALAICGVPTTPPPVRTSRGHEERKSIWNASEQRGPAPESRGDRKATQREPGPAADTPPACTHPQCGEVLTNTQSQHARQQAGADLCEQHLQEALRKRGGAAKAAPSELACSRPDCGKPLTKGQYDVSVRAYGQPLCPACQKQQARAAA